MCLITTTYYFPSMFPPETMNKKHKFTVQKNWNILLCYAQKDNDAVSDSEKSSKKRKIPPPPTLKEQQKNEKAKNAMFQKINPWQTVVQKETENAVTKIFKMKKIETK